ncbi:hypothetical protein [Streptomyces sp. ODS28]|uniref:hypothetical protein n=1 Tax=Streptomyces sp. ODS28 TaxID=3136688 RepID=UPI0031EA4AE4
MSAEREDGVRDDGVRNDGVRAGGEGVSGDRAAEGGVFGDGAAEAAALHVPLPPEVPMPAVRRQGSAHAPEFAARDVPGPGTAGEPGRREGEDPGWPGAAWRSGTADPVRGLLHRHRELCERAVDPLEIAAGLEAHGVTDRTAARYRHRDVFGLAEELYARVPRADAGEDEAPAPHAAHEEAPVPAGDRLARLLVPLLPAALCAAVLLALSALAQAPGPPSLLRPAVAAAGAAAVGAAARLAVVRLVLPRGAGSRTQVLVACWLCGIGLLGAAGPGEGAAGARELALGLACGVAPAVWSARWFSVRARRALHESRGLGEFAAGVRPLFAAALALFALALAGAQAVARPAVHVLGAGAPLAPLPVLGGTALGVLLYLALLLAAHGYRRAAAWGIGAAGAAEAVALAAGLAVPAHALPGGGSPVPALVPAVVCGGAAAVLLTYAFRALARASAHRPRAAG